jgi:hypothetical protein
MGGSRYGSYRRTAESRPTGPTIATLALHYAVLPNIEIPEKLPKNPAAIARLLRAVILIRYGEAIARLRDALANLHEKKRELDHVSLMCKLKVLEIAKTSVVCCTVVGASIHRNLVEAFRPEALCIEEAAEIPEPALIATLFPSLKRVVQVGDHMQLRAPITSHELCKQKNLHVSAFERLVNCHVPFEKLSTQNRMAPVLLAPVLLYYPEVQTNHAIVDKLPFPPPWLAKPLFWWDHREYETATEDSRSKANRFESQRAVMLVAFLLRQGFKAESIAVLTPYAGQLLDIRSRMTRFGREDSSLGIDEVRCKTVDEFQGDEAEIVILSLVRSDAPGAGSGLGFLTELNRQIVATSRHKCALIIIGNSEHCSQSNEWRRLIDKLASVGNLGQELPLVCPRHKQGLKFDTMTDETLRVSGCGLTCGEVLSCMHPCKGKCHGPEKPHRRCEEMVEIALPCGHKQTHPCGSKSIRCEFEHFKTFEPCGHQRLLPCWQHESAICMEPCKKMLPCGHKCSLTCSMGCTDRPCRLCVDETISILRP